MKRLIAIVFVFVVLTGCQTAQQKEKITYSNKNDEYASLCIEGELVCDKVDKNKLGPGLRFEFDKYMKKEGAIVKQSNASQTEIPDYVLSPYTADQYPKLFAAFGSRIDDVQRLRRAAAEKAAASPTCDRVEVVELSQERSSLTDLNYFVDCANTTRFRFSETELASAGPAASESQKAWGEAEARSACEELIRQSASIPTSVKVHSFLGTSVYKAPSTGNVVVTSDFDAKNAFGTEIGYRAKCYFKPGIATGKIEISQRLR